MRLRLSLLPLALAWLATSTASAQSRLQEVTVDGSAGARAFVESQRAEIASCIERTVPATARGTAIIRGTIDGDSLHWIGSRSWSAPSLPYERLRICVDGLLLGNWSGEATRGEGVQITLSIAAGDGTPPDPSFADALPAPLVTGGDVDGSGGGFGSGSIGGLSRSRAPAPTTRTTPARTSSELTSSSADDFQTTTILRARAIDVFPRCLSSVTRDQEISFTLSLGTVGEVRNVRANWGRLPRDARECLEREVRAMQLPPPDGTPRPTVRFTLSMHHHPAVTVRLGSARIDESAIRREGPGTIESTAVTAAFRGQPIASCYQQPADVAAPSGRVEIRMTFDESGHARDVAIVTHELDDALARCVQMYASRARLRPTGGAVTLTVPFVFAPLE